MTWLTLATAFPIPAKPGGLWTMVIDYVDAATVLKIVAPEKAEWSYSPGSACSANGDLTAMIGRSGCLLPAGPVGALIGKIGGSTAGSADGTIFLVGVTCVFTVDEKSGGPLYLSMNDEPSGFCNNTGQLAVDVMRRA